jgi:hypothetical protein
LGGTTGPLFPWVLWVGSANSSYSYRKASARAHLGGGGGGRAARFFLIRVRIQKFGTSRVQFVERFSHLSATNRYEIYEQGLQFRPLLAFLSQNKTLKLQNHAKSCRNWSPCSYFHVGEMGDEGKKYPIHYLPPRYPTTGPGV